MDLHDIIWLIVAIALVCFFIGGTAIWYKIKFKAKEVIGFTYFLVITEKNCSQIHLDEILKELSYKYRKRLYTSGECSKDINENGYHLFLYGDNENCRVVYGELIKNKIDCQVLTRKEYKLLCSEKSPTDNSSYYLRILEIQSGYTLEILEQAKRDRIQELEENAVGGIDLTEEINLINEAYNKLKEDI